VDRCEDLNIDERIKIKRILRNRMGRCGLDSSGLEYGPVEGSCEHGNESAELVSQSVSQFTYSGSRVLTKRYANECIT
jgi:hypothetical protein